MPSSHCFWLARASTLLSWSKYQTARCHLCWIPIHPLMKLLTALGNQLHCCQCSLCTKQSHVPIKAAPSPSFALTGPVALTLLLSLLISVSSCKVGMVLMFCTFSFPPIAVPAEDAIVFHLCVDTAESERRCCLSALRFCCCPVSRWICSDLVHLHASGEHLHPIHCPKVIEGSPEFFFFGHSCWIFSAPH